MEEIWVPAFGFENAFEVSNLGIIKRTKPRTCAKAGQIRKPTSTPSGYHRIGLRDDGLFRMLQVHRLIWESFNGQITGNLQVNHINGVKSDNRLENLEVVTPSENRLHAVHVLGKKPVPGKKGDESPNSILKYADIPRIKELVQEGLNQREVADLFGIHPSVISRVLSGKVWA